MPTFKRKPETVDARQFTSEAVHDVVSWVNAHAGEGVRAWAATDKLRDKENGGYKSIWRLFIKYPNEFDVADEGDWIVWRQLGYFDVVSPQTMELEYEEV